MMIVEGMRLHGAMKSTLVKADGTVEVMKKDNMIVKSGFDFIAQAIAKSAAQPSAMSHIAIGLGDDEPTLNDTELKSESARQAATFEHSAGTYVFTMTTTFAPGTGTGRIVEAGVLNADSNGILLDRVKFDPINKGAADSLTVQFSFTLS